MGSDGEEITWLLRRLLSVASAFRSFSEKFKEVAEMPNLIEVSKAVLAINSCKSTSPGRTRPDEGLADRFQVRVPISDFSSTSMLEFVKYEFRAAEYDVDECRQAAGNDLCGAAIKVTLRLIVFDIDEERRARRSVKDIRNRTSTWATFRS